MKCPHRFLQHMAANGEWHCDRCGLLDRDFMPVHVRPTSKDGDAASFANEVIEGIWARWYGELRGRANVDQMGCILSDAKQKIINYLTGCQQIAECAPCKCEPNSFVDMACKHCGWREQATRHQLKASSDRRVDHKYAQYCSDRGGDRRLPATKTTSDEVSDAS